MPFSLKKARFSLGAIVALLAFSTPMLEAKTFSQTGIASYYAKKFNGRRTANGEIYSDNKLTAAHRTLPFGTRLEVTNLRNGKTVQVRINDRGPYSKGRIIDLSKSAARQIGLISAGVGKVRITLAGKKAESSPEKAVAKVESAKTDKVQSRFKLKALQLPSKRAAENAKKRLNLTASIVKNGQGYDLIVENLTSQAEFNQAKRGLMSLGYQIISYSEK